MRAIPTATGHYEKNSQKVIRNPAEMLCLLREDYNEWFNEPQSSSLTLISGFLPRIAQLVTAGIPGLGGTYTSKVKFETGIRIREYKGGLLFLEMLNSFFSGKGNAIFIAHT